MWPKRSETPGPRYNANARHVQRKNRIVARRRRSSSRTENYSGPSQPGTGTFVLNVGFVWFPGPSGEDETTRPDGGRNEGSPCVFPYNNNNTTRPCLLSYNTEPPERAGSFSAVAVYAQSYFSPVSARQCAAVRTALLPAFSPHPRACRSGAE